MFSPTHFSRGRACHVTPGVPSTQFEIAVPPLCCVNVLVNSFVGVRKYFVGHEESYSFCGPKGSGLSLLLNVLRVSTGCALTGHYLVVRRYKNHGSPILRSHYYALHILVVDHNDIYFQFNGDTWNAVNLLDTFSDNYNVDWCCG